MTILNTLGSIIEQKDMWDGSNMTKTNNLSRKCKHDIIYKSSTDMQRADQRATLRHLCERGRPGEHV